VGNRGVRKKSGFCSSEIWGFHGGEDSSRGLPAIAGYQRFGGPCCFHLKRQVTMEVTGSSEHDMTLEPRKPRLEDFIHLCFTGQYTFDWRLHFSWIPFFFELFFAPSSSSLCDSNLLFFLSLFSSSIFFTLSLLILLRRLVIVLCKTQ